MRAGRLDEARPLVDRWSALAPGDGEPEYYRAWLEVKADRPNPALDAMRSALGRGYPQDPLLILRAVLLARAGQFEEACADPPPGVRGRFRAEGGGRRGARPGLARDLSDGRGQARPRPLDEARPRRRPALPLAGRDRQAGRQRIRGRSSASYREALKRDPNLGDIRRELADKLLEGSKVDEAGEEYATLLSRRPKDAPAHVGSGRVALLKGDIQAAIRHFEEALAIDPNSSRALCELALIDMRFGRNTQARDRLERALRIDPDDFEARYTYARVLRAVGDPEGAAEQMESADRLREDQKQIDELRKGLVQRPDDLDLRSKVARWLVEHGHEAEGLDWARLILTKTSNHPATCELLADYHARKGNQGLANYYRSLLPPAANKP